MHKYRFTKPPLKAILENCTKTKIKVNSDHLAKLTSVTNHSVSERGVALAGGLGLHAHDGGHIQLLFTSTPTLTQVSDNP